MATVWNEEVARVFVEMSAGGRPFGSNLFFHRAAGWDSVALAAIGGVVASAWDAEIMPLLSADVNLDGARAYSLAGPDAAVEWVPISQPSPGGVPEEYAALSNAVVATLRTAQRGRGGRGRFYISGIPEGSLGESRLTETPFLQFRAAVSDLLAAFTGAGQNLVVYSTEVDGNPRVAGMPIPVTDIEIRTPIVGSQRRRNRRP